MVVQAVAVIGPTKSSDLMLRGLWWQLGVRTTDREATDLDRAIFISYRRDDAKADARSIYQHLQLSFGKRSVFIDIDSIDKGRDFVEVLSGTLSQCRVFLAVIGPGWQGAIDQSGNRRLMDEKDFVRLEIAEALKRGITIIPVLVDGAQLPDPVLLPEELQSLTRRQTAAVRHESFASDMAALELDVSKHLVSRKWPYKEMIAAAFSIGVFAALFYGLPDPSRTRTPDGSTESHKSALASARKDVGSQKAEDALAWFPPKGWERLQATANMQITSQMAHIGKTL